MIQRIQTLYLLLAGTSLVFFVYFAGGWVSSQTLTQPWVGLTALGVAGLAAVVSYAAVVLYKDRAKQKKVIQVAQVLALLTVAFVAFGIYLLVGSPLGVASYVVALAPVLAYSLLRLAQRGVDKDIEKVRSMDRLR